MLDILFSGGLSRWADFSVIIEDMNRLDQLFGSKTANRCVCVALFYDEI
jgi:hypothetical protein